jgi:hypothetical protein
VKFGTTPGVLVKDGGGAGGGEGFDAAAGAITGADAALVEELQPVIEDDVGAGTFETAGGGATTGGGAAAGGEPVELDVEEETGVTVEPLSIETAGGGRDAAVVTDTEVTDEVMTTPLSVDRTGGGGALVDEVEELYTAANV